MWAADDRAAADAARACVVIGQVVSLSGATAIEWHRTLVRGETFARVWI